LAADASGITGFDALADTPSTLDYVLTAVPGGIAHTARD
jgi:hypothetical protein